MTCGRGFRSILPDYVHGSCDVLTQLVVHSPVKPKLTAITLYHVLLAVISSQAALVSRARLHILPRGEVKSGNLPIPFWSTQFIIARHVNGMLTCYMSSCSKH